MERRRITCPETAHLEEIDLERTPLGIVIAGCSRFEPRCAAECACECAARLDRRGRDDDRERVLVVHDGADGETCAIVDALAAELRRDGLIVELANADAGNPPPPADYEAVVIGSRVRWAGAARPVRRYVAAHRDALAATPWFWFSVGRPARIAGTPLRTASFRAPSRLARWLGARASPPIDRIRAFALAIGEDVPILDGA